MNLIDTAVIEPFHRYREQFGLSNTDGNWFANLSTTECEVRRGQNAALQGQKSSNVHLLVKGWAYTAMQHADGSRTIFDVHLPGDFIVSPGILTTPRSTTLFALSHCRMAELQLGGMMEYARHSPGASQFLMYVLSRHHEDMAKRVIQTTRMPSITRVASFYLDLLERVQGIAPTVENEFFSPLTNSLVAELLGVTGVHMSRTHSRLRELGALEIDQRIVRYPNLALLEELGRIADAERLSA